MTIIVEDGSIVAGANSYVSTETLVAFASARNITLVGDPEELLIQAMDYIESLNYQGAKLTQNQPLQWPRYNVYVDGYYLSSSTIPQQLKNGEMQTAIAVDQGNGPQQDISQSAIRKKVGEIEIDYAVGSSQNVINTKIQSALYKLLGGAGGSGTIRVGKA